MGDRTVIIHYHLFKNAGSSVDAVLQHNFGDAWIEIEGPNNKKLTPEMMEEYILNNPDKMAISSHTAQITPPIIQGVKIIPIFFFRHPIDRIQSVYEFEKIQDIDSPGSKAAKGGDFGHYMAWRLASPTLSQIVNFHATRLKDYKDFTTNRETHLFRRRAQWALNRIPVVGLVERFDESMQRYAKIIRPHFPEFKLINARANTLADPSKSIVEKMRVFEENIGRLAFLNLMQLNTTDMELYHFVKENFWSEE